jgi:hypothetical protein
LSDYDIVYGNCGVQTDKKKKTYILKNKSKCDLTTGLNLENKSEEVQCDKPISGQYKKKLNDNEYRIEYCPLNQ